MKWKLLTIAAIIAWGIGGIIPVIAIIILALHHRKKRQENE